MNHFDAVVIGGGSAGYAAARTLAGAGKKVAVIEGGRDVGGLCILRGCMPTKALLYAAEVLHHSRHASTWGIHNQNDGFDFAAVMKRKDDLIAEFAAYRAGQLTDGRFEFIRAKARFLDQHTLELDNGSPLSADHFVIATGSFPSPPALQGLADTGFITSDEALTLQALPKSLIVLGGGAVAVEFAQFFQRLDVQVTLIQRSAHVLSGFDADLAAVIENVFRRDDMQVHTGTQLIGAGKTGALKRIAFDQNGIRHEAVAEEILLAQGRTPQTASLGLSAAQVECAGARIITDSAMRSNVPHIFAAGDCTGPHEIVHIAIQQGEVAAHNILHPDRPRAMDYRLLTSVVFTEPQAAQVGLTEKAATQAGRKVIISSYPFADHGKSLIMEAKDGFVKMIADTVTGEIVGASCAGPMAGELIHELIVAMHHRTTVAAFAAIPHYHPTLAEIWTYPAEELAGKWQESRQ